jgi:hypothetical protein
MILYVNGDSHTAAAEAVNTHAFAQDDQQYFYMGRAPHPENLAVSWGKLLSMSLQCGLHCDAESASSNARIIRTTKEWLTQRQSSNDQILVVIQWSTWEREEWLIDGTYYQVNASGTDQVPEQFRQYYKEYIAGINWQQRTESAHEEIWNFHKELQAQGIKHVFFNGNNDFSKIPDQEQRAWDMCYVAPYDPTMTFDAICRKQGFETVAPGSWHFGRDAHSFFHRYLLKFIILNKFVA